MITFKLTKEDFIKRSMLGDRFIDELGNVLFYDPTRDNPFRCDNVELTNLWTLFNSHKFSLVEPEPVIQRRYKWYKDYGKYTMESSFVSDEFAEEERYTINGWYKTDRFIDVEIKQ